MIRNAITVIERFFCVIVTQGFIGGKKRKKTPETNAISNDLFLEESEFGENEIWFRRNSLFYEQLRLGRQITTYGSSFSTVSTRGFVVVSKKKYTTIYVRYVRLFVICDSFHSFVSAFYGNRVPKFSSRQRTCIQFSLQTFFRGKLAGTVTYKTRNEFANTVYEHRPSARRRCKDITYLHSTSKFARFGGGGGDNSRKTFQAFVYTNSGTCLYSLKRDAPVRSSRISPYYFQLRLLSVNERKSRGPSIIAKQDRSRTKRSHVENPKAPQRCAFTRSAWTAATPWRTRSYAFIGRVEPCAQPAF